MNVNIDLKRNFVNAYNSLQNEFGEEMAAINGFSSSQLSYTDFIDNFVDTDTVADVPLRRRSDSARGSKCDGLGVRGLVHVFLRLDSV